MGTLADFTPRLRANHTLPEIFESLVGDLGLEILPGTQLVRFYCPCSFNRMMGALKMLGVDELQDMMEKDEGAEATCHFCGEVYHANRAELAQLIDDLNQGQAKASLN
jgi:molecular chaperone Hsp33